MSTKTAFDKYGWFKTAVLASDDLTHGDRSVLMVFFAYSNGEGRNAHPGRQRIAADACVHRSKLDGHLKKLLDLGYIVLEKQGGNAVKKGHANVYRLGVPHRLSASNSDSSTRGTATVHADDEDYSQGAPSGNEGAPPRYTRGTVKVHEGAPSGVPQQSKEQINEQTNECVTSNSHELPDKVRKFSDLKQVPAYQFMLNWIMKAASEVGNDYDKYDEAFEQVCLHIEEMFGPDYSEFMQHEWTIPAKAATKYHAGVWAKTFINGANKDGRAYYPADSDTPVTLDAAS